MITLPSCISIEYIQKGWYPINTNKLTGTLGIFLNAMHLAISTTSLRIGGAERVAVNLSEGLVKRGYDVDLILVSAEGELINEVHNAVNIVNLSSHRVLTAVPALARYLRKNQPDVLYSMMPHNNIAAFLSLMTVSNVTFVPSVHNMLTSKLDSPKEMLLFLISRYVYRQATHCVAVSEGVRDELVRVAGIPREQTSVIYNPIVSNHLQEQANQEPDHDWFEEAKIVLAAGRHIEQKGFDTLLRAFSSVCYRTPQDTRLLVLGQGPKTKDYRQIARNLGIVEIVDFPGFVDNIYAYLASADLFVLPSRWEGFGNILVEAMACGTQVVATDCQSGPAEILQDGKYGQLVPVDDVPALAEAIYHQLIDDSTCDVQKRANAFTVEAVADSYNELLTSLITGHCLVED